MKIIDRKCKEVLTEWCRNKPENAAVEILTLQDKVLEIDEVYQKLLQEIYISSGMNDEDKVKLKHLMEKFKQK